MPWNDDFYDKYGNHLSGDEDGAEVYDRDGNYVGTYQSCADSVVDRYGNDVDGNDDETSTGGKPENGLHNLFGLLGGGRPNWR